MSFVFHFCILGLTSWIWTDPSAEGLKFESPSKWNSYEGFNLEHWPGQRGEGGGGGFVWPQEPTSVGHRRYKKQSQMVDSWFFTLYWKHVPHNSCTGPYTLNPKPSIFHFYILGSTFWIWTNPSTEELKFESPSNGNSYEGFYLEHWLGQEGGGVALCDHKNQQV